MYTRGAGTQRARPLQQESVDGRLPVALAPRQAVYGLRTAAYGLRFYAATWLGDGGRAASNQPSTAPART